MSTRTSPLRIQLLLLGLFAVIATIGVFTVLLPEIRDDSNEDVGGQEAAEANEPGS